MATHDWWIVPVTLLALGIFVMFLSFLWAGKQPASYTGLGGCFQVMLGIAAFLVCAALATGYALARWLM